MGTKTQTETEAPAEVYQSMSEFRRNLFPEREKAEKRRRLRDEPSSFGAELAESLLNSASERLHQD